MPADEGDFPKPARGRENCATLAFVSHLLSGDPHMSSRLSGRPACLRAVVVVFALVCSLFAFSPAYAAGSSISGKVTKPSGSALGNSVVDLYSVDDDGYWFEKS